MNRIKVIQVRLTPEEKKQIEESAAADRRSLSSWIRFVLLKKPEKKEPDGGNDGNNA